MNLSKEQTNPDSYREDAYNWLVSLYPGKIPDPDGMASHLSYSCLSLIKSRDCEASEAKNE